METTLKEQSGFDAADPISVLEHENQRLQQQLRCAESKILELEKRYAALEEDFMHALSVHSTDNLNDKRIVLVGAKSKWLDEYRAISDKFETQLIVIGNDSELDQAVETADEVICTADCPNQKLCNMARFSCSKFNKPMHELTNSTPANLQKKLAEIALQVV